MPIEKALWYALGSLAIVLLWALLGALFPTVIFPSPGETLQALALLARQGVLANAVLVTLGRIVLAFGLSTVAGVGLGILAGLQPRVHGFLKPSADLAMAAPPITWLVLALVWFGTGAAAPIFTVIVVATPVIFANAYAGVRAVDRQLVEMAHVYGARRRDLLQDIYLPAMSPHLFAGLGVAISMGVRVGVMGELLGSDSGIGSALALARIYLDTPQVFAWVLVTVALLIVLEGVLIRPLQHYAERWRRQP
jgi:NitT/TauT family transport system permease protein